MALLDRLKERVETDLSDAELQLILDEINTEIVERYGPEGEITEILDTQRDLKGYRKFHKLDRPIDTGQAVTVVETEPASASGAPHETTLDATDFRVVHRGRTIERLITGTNGREHWAELVTVTYTPVSKQAQRDEVAIEIAKLQVRAGGVSAERAGDFQATYPDLHAEREKLLTSLTPMQGLVLA